MQPLEFSTPDGETFVLWPGDVVGCRDHVAKGHKWRLIEDQPWRRGRMWFLSRGPGLSFIS